MLVVAATAQAGTVTVKGSDTLVGLSHRWAHAFARAHPGTSVQITGGGSSAGLAALEANSTDIAISSRALSAEERARLGAQPGGGPRQVAVARDAVAFFVNAHNPLRAVSVEELHAVLVGDLTSWAAFGGPDRPIITYTRENTSGTYAFVREKVLHDDDYAPNTQPLQGTGAVVNAVSQERWGLGFGGTAFARGVRVLAVKVGADEVLPTDDHVRSGRYPLSRELYFDLAPNASLEAQAFLDFVLSPEGQAIAVKAGFLPLN